jgi:hypothetical protein
LVKGSGHIHKGAIWLTEKTGLPYSVTTCGGQKENGMVAVTVQFGVTGIDQKVLTISGSIVEQTFISRK